MPSPTVDDPIGLADGLAAARADFRTALAALPPDRHALPLVEGWDARDLVWHVAFWAEHGTRAIELALAGRGDEFDYDSTQTDAMNAAAAERGRLGPLEVALECEEAAYRAFATALAGLSARLLDEVLGNGDRLVDVIRYDGPDHYAEHTAHLRGT